MADLTPWSAAAGNSCNYTDTLYSIRSLSLIVCPLTAGFKPLLLSLIKSQNKITATGARMNIYIKISSQGANLAVVLYPARV